MMKGTVALIAAISIGACVFAADFVDQGDVITYDEANQLVFEDVGRVTYRSANGQIGFTHGKFVRLHVTRDGKSYDLDLVNDKGEGTTLTSLDFIKYRDKSHIWLAYYLKKLGTGVDLVSLETGKFVSGYVGYDVRLSPKADKVSYYIQVQHRDRKSDRVAVFVDGCMVYPKVLNDVILRPEMVTQDDDDPRPPTGQSLKSLVRGLPKSKVSEMEWVDNETLSLVIDESVNDTTKTQSVKYVISGLSTKAYALDPDRIRVKKAIPPRREGQ